jgi:hypothetical protein
MAKFKVRRNALFTQSASITQDLEVDQGLSTKSGSVSTFAGGLTAGSTFSVTGCAIAGSDGTPLAGILAGSGNLVVGALASSATSAASFSVTGLTSDYKVFVTAACLSGSVTVACAWGDAGTCDLVVRITNQSDEALGAGTSAVFYFAVLDK